MKFGWINIFGGVIVVLMLVPNIVWALRHKDKKNLCTNKPMNLLEQIGRYACIVLMWLPLFVWEFGFKSVGAMLVYLVGNGLLLLAYYIVFAMYFRQEKAEYAIALAVLPSCIFLLSGLMLRHWALIGFAIIFAVGHIYVTRRNCYAAEKPKA